VSDHDYLNGGWKRKYHLTKADGSPVDPQAIYFVLRLDEDPCARRALAVYADAVSVAGNPNFGAELARILDLLERPRSQRESNVFGDSLDCYRYGLFSDNEDEEADSE